MTYRQRVQTQALLKRNKQEAGSLAIFVSLAKVGLVVHSLWSTCGALLKCIEQYRNSLQSSRDTWSLAKVGPVVHTVDMSCTQWSEA